MPDYGTDTVVSRVNLNIELLDVAGKSWSINSSKIPATYTSAEFATFRNAIAGGSNAALLSDSFTNKNFISKGAARNNMYDDAYASGSMKATFVFEDDNGDIRSFAVPAPDASMFGPDNQTVDIVNSSEAAAIAGAGALLFNGGAAGSGTFVFVRGYLSGRVSSPPPQVVTTAPQEPGAGASPPPEPGT